LKEKRESGKRNRNLQSSHQARSRAVLWDTGGQEGTRKPRSKAKVKSGGGKGRKRGKKKGQTRWKKKRPTRGGKKGEPRELGIRAPCQKTANKESVWGKKKRETTEE